MQGSKTVQRCQNMETSLFKSNAKLKMNENSQKGTKQLKMKEKIAKKKEKRKTKRKRQRQTIDKTQLKTMVGIYSAAETGAMKLV